MILDSGTSSSDTKIKDDVYKKKYSKIKTLYLGLMCFATNCLSSIDLEASSRGTFRSILPARSAVFNNLFRRNYNLRIKIMVTNVLMALVSTTMLTIGDMYKIPYLYLPWLFHTFEGLILYEGPTLYKLACTVLPNASVPAGLFIFLTLLLYMEELYIWKDIFVHFKHCWTNYINKKLKTKQAESNNELCDKDKEKLNTTSKESKDKEETINSLNELDNHNTTTKLADLWNKFDNHNAITESINFWDELDNSTNPAEKSIQRNFLKSHRNKSPFTEVSG